jgi:hypothetical protein
MKRDALGGTMSELPIGTIRQIVWGDQEELDKVDLDAQPNLMDDFILRNQVQAAVKSANGASIVFDLAPPSESDVDDDTPLYKSPRIIQGVSSALAKTSDDKFVKCLATIRRVFAGHDEEMAEAIAVVTKIRAEVRTETIAAL